MFKKVSMSLATLVVLTACSACAKMDEDVNVSPVAAPMMGSDAAAGAMSHGSASSDTLTKAAMANAHNVNFGFDSAALTKEARAKLSYMAKRIKSENPTSVVVEGHADERGTREYNLALGDRRAVSAKKYLVGSGVDSKLITTISYGKERPMDAAHNEAAWAKNRRAMVVLK